MQHIYKKGASHQPTLILFHGTGGDEKSLLKIAALIHPRANILSLRGEVNENGSLRFFKRMSEGQFDVEDLSQRVLDIGRFLEKAACDYGFQLEEAILIGFSNGANMAMALLLANHSPFKKGILMAPMYPIDTKQLTDMKRETAVFLSMGRQDPLVSILESQKVIAEFEMRGASVTTNWVKGHEVTRTSLQAAKEWLESGNQRCLTFH